MKSAIQGLSSSMISVPGGGMNAKSWGFTGALSSSLVKVKSSIERSWPVIFTLDMEVGRDEELDLGIGEVFGIGGGGDPDAAGGVGLRGEFAEFFPEVEFAEEKGEGCAEVLAGFELGFFEALIVGGVEEDVFAVG
jgi:hypothetical protein